MAFEIKDPPEFTLEVEQWNKKTKANGEQMALVIEKLLNNEVFLKGLIERLEGNAVKVGDKGIPGGVASLGTNGKLEQRVDYDKIDDVPAPAWGNITGKPSNYSPSSHTHAKSEVGLGNVDNTADARKSVSYAASAGDADTVDGKHASAFAASSHTHSAATQSAAGLMSADDKKKLDGVAASANNYTHPSSHSASMINQDTSHRFVTDTEKNTWNGKAAGNHSHSGMLTTSDLVDNCTSTATNKAPTAKQAKLLMDKYNQLNSDINTVMEMSFTYASGFSDCDSNWKTQCFRIGKRLYVKINCKRSSALAAGSTVDILTLNSSLSLYGDFNFVLSTGPIALIGTVYASRTVSVRVPDLQTLAANTWVQGYFEIILK